MKTLVACLLLVAVAQATNWAKVKPVFRQLPTLTQRAASNGRIIGGSEATPGQFPYQAGLILDGFGFCGGSLISSTVVLTAAHCADGTSSYEVHLGAHEINNLSEPGRLIVTTTDGTMHQNYNPNNLNNDIAVVVLTAPVSGSTFSPISVPARSQASDLFVGVVARVSGWGRVSDSDPNLSPVLKYVDLTVVDNTVCDGVYGANVIADSMLCLDTAGGTAGSCNGDSGGPLVYQGRQIGLVSFGASAGCEAGFPLGYTRLTSYLDWLEQNAGITIDP